MNQKHDTETDTADLSSQAHKKTQLAKVAMYLERMRLGDYIMMMNRPRRLIWLNFWIGVSRGIGLTVGATIVLAIIFKVVGWLISMNIPYLTEVLQDIVQVVKETPGLEKVATISDLPQVPQKTSLITIKEPAEPTP